jgi:hypothetical protein
MKRTLLLASLLVLAGCQLPEDRLPRPLPDDAPPMAYAELLTRARAQARVATEAFYVDKWAELEDAARGLEQTARFLPKAVDVPPSHKDLIPKVSTDLSKQAGKLREAALAKNEKDTTEILKQVNLKVRELRLAP